MYSDRELLELAAKAAGYDVRFELDSEGDYRPRVVSRLYIGGFRDGEWNPLTDDGDALRLAVKLHMQVSVTTESCRAETLPCLGVRVNDKDELSATRRAIVRAAAAIGEAM